MWHFKSPLQAFVMKNTFYPYKYLYELGTQLILYEKKKMHFAQLLPLMAYAGPGLNFLVF